MKEPEWLYGYCRRDQIDLLPAALVWATSRGVTVERQECPTGGFTLRVRPEQAQHLWQVGKNGDRMILLPFRWADGRDVPAEGWPLSTRKTGWVRDNRPWLGPSVVIGAAATLEAR